MSDGSTFVSTHCWANNVCQCDLSLMYQSIPSLTNPPPGRPPGIRTQLVATGVGFSLLCFARGVLDQSNSEKRAIFALSLKQHMFLYARSEQRDLVPIRHYNKYTAYQNLSR